MKRLIFAALLIPAAIFAQQEVMRDLLLVKAHALVPAMLHLLVFGMVLRRSGSALWLNCQRRCQNQ